MIQENLSEKVLGQWWNTRWNTWGSRDLCETESSKEAGLVRVYVVVEEIELERNQKAQYTPRALYCNT